MACMLASLHVIVEMHVPVVMSVCVCDKLVRRWVLGKLEHACVLLHVIACTYTYAHAHTHIHTHTRMHARTHARTRTHTHARTHTHTHTHTELFLLLCTWHSIMRVFYYIIVIYAIVYTYLLYYFLQDKE